MFKYMNEEMNNQASTSIYSDGLSLYQTHDRHCPITTHVPSIQFVVKLRY